MGSSADDGVCTYISYMYTYTYMYIHIHIYIYVHRGVHELGRPLGKAREVMNELKVANQVI